MASNTGMSQEPSEPRYGAPWPPDRKASNLAMIGFGLSVVPWAVFALLMTTHPR